MAEWFAWIPTAYLISEWAIRIGMTPFVVRRRTSTSAMAWLLIIYFLPWAGFILYGMLGQRRLGRRRLQRYADARKRIETPVRMAAQEIHVVHPSLPPEQDDLVLLCERLSGLPIVGGNHVEFIQDTQGFINSLIDDIDEAKHHVHLLFYIVADDATGQRVADALIRAKERGVECRLLIDSVGGKGALETLRPRLEKHGVQVQEALPAGFFRQWLRRVDLRNHRKIAVIDGHVGYTGSQNIVNANYGHSKVGAWHDLMMRVTGPTVLGLQIVFTEDWFAESDELIEDAAYFPAPDTSGDVSAQLVQSGPNDESDTFRSVTIAAINEAQRHVILTTPYFIPDEPLLYALRLACLRGVKVDLIVPKRSDQRLVGAAAQSFYPTLLEYGVRVHLHHPGLLHAKSLCVDESFAMVGSGNLDCRSFFLNFELSLLLYGQTITKRLRECQQEYLDGSEHLELSRWVAQPAWRNVLRDIAALFGPIL